MLLFVTHCMLTRLSHLAPAPYFPRPDTYSSYSRGFSLDCELRLYFFIKAIIITQQAASASPARSSHSDSTEEMEPVHASPVLSRRSSFSKFGEYPLDVSAAMSEDDEGDDLEAVSVQQLRLGLKRIKDDMNDQLNAHFKNLTEEFRTWAEADAQAKTIKKRPKSSQPATILSRSLKGKTFVPRESRLTEMLKKEEFKVRFEACCYYLLLFQYLIVIIMHIALTHTSTRPFTTSSWRC